MDFDERKLNEMLSLTRENNKILRAMRRSQRWDAIFKVLYWGVIFVALISAFYYIRPVYQKYAEVMETSMGAIERIQNIMPI